MPNPPIHVYLDSSDYSELSDIRILETKPTLKSVLQYLNDVVSNGRIEIRFSAIHIAEAIQTTPEAQPYALYRIKLLKDLSRQRCLLYWDDLVQLDVLYSISARNQRQIDLQFPTYAYSNEGCYYPDMSASAHEFANMRDEMMMDVLREMQIPTAQRWFVMKEIARGRRSPLVQALLAASGPLVDEQLKGMPVTERFRQGKYFERFLFHEITPSEFVTEMLRGVLEPEQLITTTYMPEEKRRELAEWIRNQGKAVKDAITDARIKVELARLLGVIDHLNP